MVCVTIILCVFAVYDVKILVMEENIGNNRPPTISDDEVFVLTSDLYYDLLDKHTKLQDKLKMERSVNRILRTELEIYKEYCTTDKHVMAISWNRRVDTMIKILHSSRNFLDAITRMRKLKIILENS